MLNEQSLRDKQLLAWDRERRRLPKAPVRPLEPPIQKGWKRHFVLTTEAEARPDSAMLEAILFETDAVVYHERKDFQPSRRELRRARGTLSNQQFPASLCPWSWDRGAFPETWRKYFRHEWISSILPIRAKRRLPGEDAQDSWDWRYTTNMRWAYVFRFPKLFQLVTVRHWLTHFTEIEPDVETRRAELAGYIHRHGGDYRLDKLLNVRPWRGNKVQWHKELLEQHTHEMQAAMGARDSQNLPGVADAVPLPRLLKGSGTPSAWLGGPPKKFSSVYRHRLLGEKQHPGGGTLLLPG